MSSTRAGAVTLSPLALPRGYRWCPHLKRARKERLCGENERSFCSWEKESGPIYVVYKGGFGGRGSL